MEFDRQVTDSYWTNICDPDIPFIGIIEHTNFVGTERYGGGASPTSPTTSRRATRLLELDLEGLFTAYEAGLRKVNPGWSRSWVKQACFVEPAAQPIVTAGFARRMPPLQTPVRGLVLANTTQVYPEDRGTNYAVRLGDEAAAALVAGAPARVTAGEPA
jgi:protoporphyrinogen oxidase